MDRIHGTTATPDHQFTEGDPSGGIAATIVSATWLNGVQNEIVNILEVAGITPDEAVHTQLLAALMVLFATGSSVSSLAENLASETSAREDADSSLAGRLASTDSNLSAESSALRLQQIYTRVFSNGLRDFFPLAVPDDPTEIRAQSRIVHHKNATGKTVYAELFFHWSATSAGSVNSGWTIPDGSDTLGPGIDFALRELWGIGPSDEWKFPCIYGTLQCAAKLYTVSIYHQPGGAHYSIQGWDQAANRLPFGDLRFLIPGENL